MGAIDIGAAAINRGSVNGGLTTFISVDNPANDTGTITSFEVYLNSDATSYKFGTFYGSGTSYTWRDYESGGAIASGSKQTLTGLNCTVSSGDFVGATIGGTNPFERDTSGYGGLYYRSGDQFLNSGAQTYTLLSGDAISLYGTGVTVAAGNPYYYYLNQ